MQQGLPKELKPLVTKVATDFRKTGGLLVKPTNIQSSAAFFFVMFDDFFRAPGHRRNHRTERASWIAVGWAAGETVRDAIALLVATWKQSARHNRGHPVRGKPPNQFTLKFVHKNLFKIHKKVIMISRRLNTFTKWPSPVTSQQKHQKSDASWHPVHS